VARALLSVSDKTGLRELAERLVKCGYSLLASGGTAQALAGLPVIEVADYTGFPEMLGGRVKTLHPAVHGAILARAEDEIPWEKIDLVVVNLYPFEEAPGIENIDVGGVTLMRAAAKNHERVTLLSRPADYELVLAEIETGGTTPATRQRLAAYGFERTAHYDAAIARHLSGKHGQRLELYPLQELRYGENPHQQARLYGLQADGGPLGGRLLQGKELSYNNLLDLDAAWHVARSYDEPAVCLVKHLSPCGVAIGATIAEAFAKALACDPLSAFGGVMAANGPVDPHVDFGDLFLECVAAPAFDNAGLAKRVNCRLLELSARPSPGEWRSVSQGVLWQERDEGDPPGTVWQVVSQRQPTEQERRDLEFAWKACQHVKSNAIVLAAHGATVGIGGGQPNRVDCVKIAVNRAGERARGAVLASDAFFPFPDSVERAVQAGVTAIVHPGGSKRDAESIKVADEHGVAMLLTGVRHFRH